MPDDFAARNAAHEAAVARVIAVFARHQFETFSHGTETDGPQANEILGRLQGSWDRTSLLLRYRPDRVFARPATGAVLVEVKSCRDRPNVSIEVASYVVARRYAETGHQVVMCISILPDGPELACSVFDLPAPVLIDVPQRWDAKEQEAFCRQEFPAASFRFKSHQRGSGTAFYVVREARRRLVPLDEFIRLNLVGAPAPAAPASNQGTLPLDW